MPVQTDLFGCLTDNFGVLIHDLGSGATASIDAPEAGPVEAALKRTGWRLTDILVTHHHGDHTGGIAQLKQAHKCRVVAPRNEAQRIPLVDETVGEGDTVKVGALAGRVIETPGHTAGHISYFFPAEKLAFVGDTLFSIGCGRVIEGNPAMMWQSLLKLRGLPDDTQFYCGHEYTQANVRFAKTIEPNNKALAARAEEVSRLLGAGKSTIPATIGAEKAANPFLRADVTEVAQSVGLAGSPAWKVFAEIRERKNKFGGGSAHGAARSPLVGEGREGGRPLTARRGAHRIRQTLSVTSRPPPLAPPHKGEGRGRIASLPGLGTNLRRGR
jgi:hydroxyacylglutathione hydrolase